jgi:hypothetical protein
VVFALLLLFIDDFHQMISEPGYAVHGANTPRVGSDHASRSAQKRTVKQMRTAARENRAFLGRAVRYLAEEADASRG